MRTVRNMVPTRIEKKKISSIILRMRSLFLLLLSARTSRKRREMYSCYLCLPKCEREGNKREDFSSLGERPNTTTIRCFVWVKKALTNCEPFYMAACAYVRPRQGSSSHSTVIARESCRICPLLLFSAEIQAKKSVHAVPKRKRRGKKDRNDGMQFLNRQKQGFCQ